MRRGSNPLSGLMSAYGTATPVGVAGVDASTDNPAYTPPWNVQQATGTTPQVLTPSSIIGKAVMNTSPWGPWLDAAGAKEPGGIKMAGGFGNVADSLGGLQAAGPSPQERQARLARMQNQAQPAANFYPNAKNFPYNPFPQS